MDTLLDVRQHGLRRYPAPQIYSSDEFVKVLKRERFRADRDNYKFAMVVISLQRRYETKQELTVLEEVIQRSVRISDEFGWFDEKRIAVILADTPDNGARVLARKIEIQMESFNIPVSFSISSYPSDKKYYRLVDNTNINYTVDLLEKAIDGFRLPWWKRLMDVTVSLFLLMLISPLLLAVAVFVKWVSPGPVFFRQERVGRGGEIFNFLKFRTMHCNSDESLHRQHSKEFITCENNTDIPMVKLDICDRRIIPFGFFLRQSCIDELPQLINVLRGEMTLVGPRPCIPYEAENYLQWHARRFDVTPGMTGLWQISGKNRTTFREMIRLDIAYAESRSFLFDLTIIAKTPLVILSQVREVFEQKLRSGREKVEIAEVSVSRVAEIA
jgi:lipopolysaccharide/colanic/teichoic acid biosynthesis glycosyltransferase